MRHVLGLVAVVVVVTLLGTYYLLQREQTLQHCNNGIQDAGETGIDCGGSCGSSYRCNTLPNCREGMVLFGGSCLQINLAGTESCTRDFQCRSGACRGGVCRFDHLPIGAHCIAFYECARGLCANGYCQIPAKATVLTGDMGHCESFSDCKSGVCNSGFCQ